MSNRAAVVAVMFALASITGGTALAQNKCKAAKQKAAGKAAAGALKCESKGDAKGLADDLSGIEACETKPEGTLAGAYSKADGKAPPVGCAGSAVDTESAIETCETNVNAAVMNAGSPRMASKCDGKIVAAMAKTTGGQLGCDSKESAGKGDQSACRSALSMKFSDAMTKLSAATDCSIGHPPGPSDTTTFGNVIADCRTGINESLRGTSLQFATGFGTTSCGAAGLATPPLAPFSGEIDSDTAGTMKIRDLGLACLYIGGGAATTVPPGGIPAYEAFYFDIIGTNLVASDGEGSLSCTKGPSPSSKHCINSDTHPSCTAPSDCFAGGGDIANACQPAESCLYGPPLEFPAGATTTCVVNVVSVSGSGTIDATTGNAGANLPLQSRVYLTGNATNPCPKCVAGQCDASAANPGATCTVGGSTGTSHDCPPEEGGGFFNGALPIGYQLTTGDATLTSAAGTFCQFCGNAAATLWASPPVECTSNADCAGLTGCGAGCTFCQQKTPGAFGQSTARRIVEHGSAAGDLTDGASHAAVQATAFCIPPTSSGTINGVADIPGPGATTLPGAAQIVPTP